MPPRSLVTLAWTVFCIYCWMLIQWLVDVPNSESSHHANLIGPPTPTPQRQLNRVNTTVIVRKPIWTGEFSESELTAFNLSRPHSRRLGYQTALIIQSWKIPFCLCLDLLWRRFIAYWSLFNHPPTLHSIKFCSRHCDVVVPGISWAFEAVVKCRSSRSLYNLFLFCSQWKNLTTLTPHIINWTEMVLVFLGALLRVTSQIRLFSPSGIISSPRQEVNPCYRTRLDFWVDDAKEWLTGAMGGKERCLSKQAGS